MVKEYLKKKLTPLQILKLKRVYEDAKSIWAGGDLNKLAKALGCDKYGRHAYTIHYVTHFSTMRNKCFNLLEIGVGGYDNPLAGGASLRMWKKYFRKAKIHGVDIHDKSALEESRIRIFKGSQVDKNFLDEVLKVCAEPEIIIDDGSHINEHVIETFTLLFPKLKSGGIYVIEDTQTSYFKEYGGDEEDINNPNTMVNFFKSLVDCVNRAKLRSAHLVTPPYQINAIHFYQDLVFIVKK